MTTLRPDEIRKMSAEEREEQLGDLGTELIMERGISSSGGAPENPGRIKVIRKTVARIKTIQREEELR